MRPQWSAKSIRQAAEDCAAFAQAQPDVDWNRERAGHDFFLTRNRHGAGFWDGDWPKRLGEQLTAEAHAYGSANVFFDADTETLELI